ncbi:MAG: leucine-rich repeat domain-containing protein, partial [Alistipes sp.]|nr:leucine-rich repeat domain-containing protein [Alistipes sp.]
TIAVETPGTLGKLLADYDKTTITELTLIGNLSSSDISILNRLPNLAVLDMENVNLETLSDKAFWNNQSLTSVKLPRTLKTIGKDAFINCRSLTSVTIGNSVTEIGDSAFWGCGLTNVTISDSVTTICNSAFAYCNLISVTIGNSVKTIFSGAFTNYVSLASIYCKAQTPPTMESGDAFNGVATSTPLYVPIGCADAYRADDDWKKFENIIEMEF